MTYGKRVADHIRDDPVTSEGGHSPDHPEAGEPAEPTAVEPGPAATARRLDAPGDGVPPVVVTRTSCPGDRGPGRGHRAGRRRRRARFRVPLRAAGLPGPAPPRGRRHRADRSRPPERPAEDWPTRSATPSGSCTRRARTCRAWPRSVSAPAPSCSTPSWRPASPDWRGSGSPRWSSSCWVGSWPRSTPRSTGPPGRCPSRGCATPRSTSRSSSRSATPCEALSTSRGSWPGRVRSSPRRAHRLRRPRRDPWRRTSGLHRLATVVSSPMLRELWTAREELARRRDVAPGRLLPDSSLVAAVQAAPQSARSSRPSRPSPAGPPGGA